MLIDDNALKIDVASSTSPSKAARMCYLMKNSSLIEKIKSVLERSKVFSSS